MSVLAILHAEIDFVSIHVLKMILALVMPYVGWLIINQYAPVQTGLLETQQYHAICVIYYHDLLEIFLLVYTIIYFTAPRPECTTDPECPDHLACIREKCQNPCFTTTCGVNAECRVTRHRAICYCKPGYEGDPYRICEERKQEYFYLFEV